MKKKLYFGIKLIIGILNVRKFIKNLILYLLIIVCDMFNFYYL